MNRPNYRTPPRREIRKNFFPNLKVRKTKNQFQKPNLQKPKYRSSLKKLSNSKIQKPNKMIKIITIITTLTLTLTTSSNTEDSEALLLMSMMIKNQINTQTRPITQRQTHLTKTLSTLHVEKLETTFPHLARNAE